MKKIILACILLLTLTFTFCLTGCDEGKYWEAVSVNCEEVFVSQNFDDVFNIKFCSKLEIIMDQPYGSRYAELKNVFKPLFESAVYYSYNHYKDFLVIPQRKSSKFKSATKTINKNAANFAKALEEFVDAKSDYESDIAVTSETEASSDQEIARLLLFKREYITVIESAYKLSESLFDARRIGYYDYSDYTSTNALLDERSDCSLAVNASNLQITKIALKITRAYNAKQMASEYQNYWSESQSFHNEIVKQFENNNLSIAPDVKDKLKVWQGVYEVFEQECKTLEKIINEIDVWELAKNGNNAKTYATKTGNEQDEIKATYYLNFYKNIQVLKNYTTAIFN